MPSTAPTRPPKLPGPEHQTRKGSKEKDWRSCLNPRPELNILQTRPADGKQVVAASAGDPGWLGRSIGVLSLLVDGAFPVAFGHQPRYPRGMDAVLFGQLIDRALVSRHSNDSDIPGILVVYSGGSTAARCTCRRLEPPTGRPKARGIAPGNRHIFSSEPGKGGTLPSPPGIRLAISAWGRPYRAPDKLGHAISGVAPGISLNAPLGLKCRGQCNSLKTAVNARH